MAHTTISKPEAAEYAPYYAKYVALVHENDCVKALTNQLPVTLELLRGISEEKAAFRYAPDKWSIKQMIGHICDTERIFAFRALCFARGEKAKIPGMEQDEYVAAADFDARTLADLTDEFETVRRATLSLFRHLSDEAWQQRGVASDNEITVRALAFIIAGHERYHVKMLQKMYLV